MSTDRSDIVMGDIRRDSRGARSTDEGAPVVSEANLYDSIGTLSRTAGNPWVVPPPLPSAREGPMVHRVDPPPYQQLIFPTAAQQGAVYDVTVPHFQPKDDFTEDKEVRPAAAAAAAAQRQSVNDYSVAPLRNTFGRRPPSDSEI